MYRNGKTGNRPFEAKLNYNPFNRRNTHTHTHADTNTVWLRHVKFNSLVGSWSAALLMFLSGKDSREFNGFFAVFSPSQPERENFCFYFHSFRSSKKELRESIFVNLCDSFSILCLYPIIFSRPKMCQHCQRSLPFWIGSQERPKMWLHSPPSRWSADCIELI